MENTNLVNLNDAIHRTNGNELPVTIEPRAHDTIKMFLQRVDEGSVRHSPHKRTIVLTTRHGQLACWMNRHGEHGGSMASESRIRVVDEQLRHLQW